MRYMPIIGLMVTLTFVILAFAGCLGSSDSSYSQGEVRYTISVTNSTHGERYILLPIPVDDDGKTWPLLDHLVVESGSGTFEVTEDIHGKCLKVTFSDEIVLYAKLRVEDSRDLYFDRMTMTAPGGGGTHYDNEELSDPFYAYCSDLEGNESVSVSLDCWSKYYWEHGPECGLTRCDVKVNGEILDQGWSADLYGGLMFEEP